MHHKNLIMFVLVWIIGIVGCSWIEQNHIQQPSHILLSLAKEAWENEHLEQCEEYLHHVLSQKEEASAYLLLAWLKLRQAQWPTSLEYARRARELDPKIAQTYFFEAADCLIRQDYLSAWKWCDTVRILFPDYEFSRDDKIGLQATLWRVLLELEQENLPETGLEFSEKALRYFPNHPIYLRLRAKFLYDLGKISESETCLLSVLQQNPYELQAVMQYRLILFQRGEYQKAFHLWKKLVPHNFLVDQENQIRDRYLALENAIRNACLDDPTTLLVLAKSLIRFGWEKEALFVYQKIPHTLAEQRQLQQHIQFLQGLQTIIEENYRLKNNSIIRVFDSIANLAKQYNIPIAMYPSRELDTYFMVVREINPYAILPGTLGAYLAEYNKVLDLGNNYGYLDCRLMNRISLRTYTRKLFGETTKYHVIIGDETKIDNYIGFYSGSPKVAGRTFLSYEGFYIALDTIRPSLGLLQKIHSDSMALQSQSISLEKFSTKNIGYDPILSTLLLDKSLQKNLPYWPILANMGEENFAWDLIYQAILERQTELVHFHELGHIHDFPCFLPMHENLGNLFKMLWENGLSPERIHTRFEATAEIFGLTNTPDPHYYLSQIMERLDVNYSGIFELVYWAWYGKMPNQDPYYRASIDILQNIQILSEQPGTTFFYQITQQPTEKLQTIFDFLQKKAGIHKNCRTP